MSTEFFLKVQPTLMGILHGEQPLELCIGTSSGGWCFMLNIYPSQGIHSLRDWHKLMCKRRNVITDEYERVITCDKMIDVITKRSGNIHPGHNFRSMPAYTDYPSNEAAEQRYMNINMAVYGPNGLLRCRISEMSHCIRHGAGTWDILLND